jgi:uncharacterized protein
MELIVMPAIRKIDPLHVRRLAISKQHLDGAKRPEMLQIIRDLGCLQIDPIRKVERPQYLMLYSRMGNYPLEALEDLRWKDRLLFEYWAHAASLVLTEDYPIHAVHMRDYGERINVKNWFAENNVSELRVHILERLRNEGALGTDDFEHKDTTNEWFSGWTSGRAVNRLMDVMWTMGEVMPSERRGNLRKWDLAERFFPEWTPRETLDGEEAAYRAMQRAVKSLGVAKGRKDINMAFTRNRYGDIVKTMKRLVDEGKLLPVQVGDLKGDWFIHVDDLARLEAIEAGDWQPKTTFLSPFDSLICNRERSRLLWDFDYTIEIYVPEKKRKFGYYVLPILHGDKLVGRMDMEMNRKTKTLHVLSTYAESHATGEELGSIRESLHDFAKWLGANEIQYGKTMPSIWNALQD